jgi:hypothetical protein
MRRPESADSSTARVAIEGARGAAENIERAGNAIAACEFAGYWISRCLTGLSMLAAM